MEENNRRKIGSGAVETETKMSFAENLCYYSIILIIKMVAALPFGLIYLLSDALYYPFYYLVRYRRRIVRSNLTKAFPDYDSSRIVAIEKRFYHFFIDMALESCKLASISPEEAKRRMQFPNFDFINGKMVDNRPVSVFMGHYCNWEWMSLTGLWIHESAIVAQIYHRLRNKAMDKMMMRLRERMGNVCVEMRKTVRFMNDFSQTGRCCAIGFIADQSPRKREVKHFLRFLHQDIPVLTGTEKATKHYGYDAVYASIKRISRGYYECRFLPLHDNPQELPDFELTALYYKRLEQDIMEAPEYYLWTHNRFKHALCADGAR